MNSKSEFVLANWFSKNIDNPYPTMLQKATLARDADLSIVQVTTWMANKR